MPLPKQIRTRINICILPPLSLCVMYEACLRREPIMPISTNAFVRTTSLLLAIAFLALATIVGTTIWLVENNNFWFNETTNARVARVATVNLRNALQDAETGQRGFLLTQEEQYLAPY